jgi:SAM-dependent methyltransferase
VTRPLRLNLAAGQQAHPEWVNVEFYPHTLRYTLPGVRRYFRRRAEGSPTPGTTRLMDLRRGISDPDATYDVVYHSNFLEHLDRIIGREFLRECFRVLRPGGIIRVVVPDIEVSARRYLEALDELRQGADGAELAHEFALVDLLDQMVRNESGGDLGRWLEAGWPDDRKPPAPRAPVPRASGSRARIRDLLIGRSTPASTGELHRWMYDAPSLGGALRAAGFVGVTFNDPCKSAIPDWDRFALDVRPDGRPLHAGCLYAEAVRPT